MTTVQQSPSPTQPVPQSEIEADIKVMPWFCLLIFAPVGLLRVNPVRRVKTFDARRSIYKVKLPHVWRRIKRRMVIIWTIIIVVVSAVPLIVGVTAFGLLIASTYADTHASGSVVAAESSDNATTGSSDTSSTVPLQSAPVQSAPAASPSEPPLVDVRVPDADGIMGDARTVVPPANWTGPVSGYNGGKNIAHAENSLLSPDDTTESSTVDANGQLIMPINKTHHYKGEATSDPAVVPPVDETNVLTIFKSLEKIEYLGYCNSHGQLDMSYSFYANGRNVDDPTVYTDPKEYYGFDGPNCVGPPVSIVVNVSRVTPYDFIVEDDIKGIGPTYRRLVKFNDGWRLAY